MRILVIGGTRFIGAAVVRGLRVAGHDVAVFHRGETERVEDLGVVHIHGDRARIADHIDSFRAFAPDVCIDMACMFERDAVATVAGLRGIISRVTVVSSVDAYRAYGRMHGSEPGPLEPPVVLEDSPLRELLYPYRGEGADGAMDDYDKIPVERAYMSDPEITGTVIRLPAVHGEGDYQRRLWMEVRRFEAQRPFVLLQEDAASWQWPRAYVENIAHAIVLVATDHRASGRVYNAPVDPPLTQRAWVAMCGRIWGWAGEVIAMPEDALPQHLRMPVNFAQSIVVDDRSIRTELGYKDAVPADEGVRRAMAWEAERGPRDRSRLEAEFAAEDAAVFAAQRRQ